MSTLPRIGNRYRWTKAFFNNKGRMMYDGGEIIEITRQTSSAWWTDNNGHGHKWTREYFLGLLAEGTLELVTVPIERLVSPGNNDGRETCRHCDAPTRILNTGLPGEAMSVCTKCEK